MDILEKINTASLQLLSPLSPEEMYKTIVEEAKKLTSADFGSILLENHGALLRVYASSSFLSQVNTRKRGHTYQAYKTNEIAVLHVTTTADFNPTLKEKGISSVIVLPLSYKNQSIGVMTLQFKTLQKFSNDQLHVLKLLASMSTLAIKKTQNLEETKRALETRDLFISLASHELRTPLTSINGYIQLLHRKLATNPGSEGKWIKELLAESNRLTNLVKEMLEINRIKQGQLQFILTECNFKDVVQKAIGRIISMYPDRRILFSPPKGNAMVIGDFEKLLQMISAILSNAIKFSPADSDIAVHLTTQKKQLVLKIIDKGEGISERDMPYIYDEFYKGTNKNGLGLGLLMAKHIVQYHKGSITIKSKPNKGTEVVLKLPKR